MGMQDALVWLQCIMGVVTLIFVVMIHMALKPATSGFGNPRSEPVKGMLTSGAGLRFQGTEFSQGYADQRREGLRTGKGDSFLGGPEPPTFYEVGNLQAAHDTVSASMWGDDGESDKKSGFGSPRDVVGYLNPY